MPQMGVSVAEGTVVAWRVEVGDRIGADQPICDISTNTIDTKAPAPVDGIVAEILIGLDETVEVGTVLARIAVGSGQPGAPAVGPTPAHEVAAPSEPAQPAGSGAAAGSGDSAGSGP